jgi:hypothetical protein
MNESDTRQCLHMVDQIRAYDNGAMPLFPLIARLEALTDLLQEPGEKWLREFRRYWSMPEDTHAAALYRRESLEHPDNVKSISAGLDGLKAHLAALTFTKNL